MFFQRKKKATLGVIIPIFNGAQVYLEPLCDSVESSLHLIKKVVVIDDGSSNKEGWLYVRSRWQKHPNVKFLEWPKNLGVPETLNRGIRELRGCDYISGIGCDDILGERFYEHFFQFIEKNDNPDLVVPKMRIFGDEQGEWAIDPATFEAGQLYRGNSIPAALVFSRNVWKRLEGFDTRLRGNFEDWDFWYRASLLEPKPTMKVEEKMVYLYRVRGDSYSRTIPLARSAEKLRDKWDTPPSKRTWKRAVMCWFERF